MTNRYSILLPALLVVVVGCGGNRGFRLPVSQEYRNVHSIDEIINDMIDDVFLKLSTDGKKKRVALLDCFNREHSGTDLDAYISTVGRLKIGQRFSKKDSKLRLAPSDKIRDYMAKMDLSAMPEDITSKAKKWKNLGVGIVISSSWRLRYDKSVDFTYEVVDTEAGGERLFSVVRTVPQDDALRKLMGQKLPGSLAVECKSSDAKVYVDGNLKGIVGSEGGIFEVPFGSHSLRIDKKGYASFSRHFRMSERGVEHVKVKFTQSHSAPVKGMFLNAAIPGVANLLYSKKLGGGNREVAVSGVFAGLFYISGTMWAIDHFKSHEFLTKEDSDKHNMIKNIELYTTIGMYVGNVVAGWFVGDAYRKVSKRGVEYSNKDVDKRVVFSVVSDNEQTKMFKVGVVFR